MKKFKNPFKEDPEGLLSLALVVFVIWFLYWIFIPMFCYDFK